MEFHIAPLQGYADYAYLQAFGNIYGPADECYSPFIRIEKGEPRRQDMARLARWNGLVPQIIFNSAQEFEALTAAIKQLGFKRIDLNLGCPFPMQTSRGRGSAMVANAEVMAEVAELVKADSDTSYSVKMRLGMKQPDEWRAILPALNSMALAHVAVHPRVATQMYGGDLHIAEFEEFLKSSANPVIYNGDISTPADVDNIAARYPSLKGVMAGRGLLARPSLIEEWRTGREWTHDERMDAILRLHSSLLQTYADTLCGDNQVLQKIKPFWEYLEPEIGRKAAKALRKAATLPKYEAAVATLA